MIFSSFFYLISGLILLYFGAEGLVRGSSSLAFRLGLTRLVIGLTIVAFGTSMPEMVVSIRAAWTRQGDIALGNVIGSNICNIALVLGLSSLIRPLRVHAQVIRIQIPVMIVVSFLLWIVLINRELTRLEGTCFLLGIIVYVSYSLYLARKESHETIMDNWPVSTRDSTKGGWLDGIFIVMGLVLLVAGARLFVSGAVLLAKTLQLSEAVIGLTVVALGTSLPELAASIVASFRKEGDIAIGNVVGSNIFNILAILGISSMVRPIGMGGIHRTDIFIMILMAILLLPLAWSGFIIKRWEGAILLLFYFCYVFYLFL